MKNVLACNFFSKPSLRYSHTQALVAVQNCSKFLLYTAPLLICAFATCFFLSSLYLTTAHAAESAPYTLSPEKTSTDTFAQWKTNAAPTQNEDPFWQKSTSPEQLFRQKKSMTQTQSSNVADNVGPKNAAPKEAAKGDAKLQLAGGAIQGDSQTVGSSWHSPASQEPVIDEDLLHGTHEVLGAYGSMVEEDNFTMSLGPELYIPEEGAGLVNKGDNRNSELGMGMKLQWGF